MNKKIDFQGQKHIFLHMESVKTILDLHLVLGVSIQSEKCRNLKVTVTSLGFLMITLSLLSLLQYYENNHNEI